jgi:hypothetical protein
MDSGMNRQLPPAAYLRECFALDATTGVLHRKHRPQHHFRTHRGWRLYHARFAGKEAGTLSPKGYVVVCLDGAFFKAHRVAFAMTTGTDPLGAQIDHIDGNRSNNSPSNLRLATALENSRNITRPRSSKSGVRGVTKSGPNWVARISCHNKRLYLGSYTSKAAATAAAQAARDLEFGAFSGKKFIAD